MRFVINVGYDGEGYSRRVVAVEAATEEEAKATSLAWYAENCSARVSTGYERSNLLVLKPTIPTPA